MSFKSVGLAIFCITVVTTRASFALIIPFGPTDLEHAGEGCVTGYTSDGARTAYYRGDTELLNTQLKAAVEKHAYSASYIVRLHGSKHTADAPELGIASRGDKQLSVDWSMAERHEPRSRGSVLHVFDSSRASRPIPYRLQPGIRIVVNIWQSEFVDIERLRVPDRFRIERVASSAE